MNHSLLPLDIIFPCSGDRLDIQVGYYQVFLELFSSGQKLALLVHYQAVAVEDQLVLSPDEVIKRYDRHVIRSACCYHPLAGIPLAEVIGGSADVDDKLGAGISLGCRRAGFEPDILADINADIDPADDVNGAFAAGPKIAVLIENAVIGQEYFMIDAGQFTIIDNSRGVIDVHILGVNEADNYAYS